MRLILIVVAAVTASACWTVGEGEKVGIVTRVAQTGAFCKTYEGTIVRGGLSGGSGAFSQPFDFTIENPSDLRGLTEAMERGDEVRITYRAEMNTFCRSDSGNHFLTSARVIRKTATGGR